MSQARLSPILPESEDRAGRLKLRRNTVDAAVAEGLEAGHGSQLVPVVAVDRVGGNKLYMAIEIGDVGVGICSVLGFLPMPRA